MPNASPITPTSDDTLPTAFAREVFTSLRRLETFTFSTHIWSLRQTEGFGVRTD
ncbi:hypothetical protein D3C83_254640 [compost metagenome]